MINPNGSNVPAARKILLAVLQRGDLPDDDADDIRDALSMMTRQTPLKIASTKQRFKITARVRDDIKTMVAQYPDATNAELAVMVGLPSCSSGRVTEVMQGLYDHI